MSAVTNPALYRARFPACDLRKKPAGQLRSPGEQARVIMIQRSYFCLCYGDVELQPKHERPLVYQTQHHENPLWIENGITTRAPVINHTDAELAMLEALVDRQPPFSPYGGGKY